MTAARHAALLASLFLFAAATASASPLDVRLGLWENGVTTESSGMPPIDTSSLSPEQKARIEALIKRRQAQGPRTRTVKSCMTKEKLAREPFSGMEDSSAKCTTHMVSQSRTRWEGKTVCTRGARTTEIEMNVTAESRERVKGTSTVKISDGRHTLISHGSYSAKWLGPDCGKLK